MGTGWILDGVHKKCLFCTEYVVLRTLSADVSSEHSSMDMGRNLMQ